MKTGFKSLRNKKLMLLAFLVLLTSISACSGSRIIFIYPDEVMEFSSGNYQPPAVFIDSITDMRPIAQRTGQGHFAHITYPADEAWESPVTEIYANALAQDLEQTQLFELVPLMGQADYVVSIDLLSFGTELKRSTTSFLLPAAIGAGLGMIMGDDVAQRAKYAGVAGITAVALLPMPTRHSAEVEARITVRDKKGDVIWQKMCLGDARGKTYITATSRHDQELVNKYLIKATKRCNACLIGQLRVMVADESKDE